MMPLRLAALLIFLLTGPALRAASESELKAAFVLKFTTFATWPKDAVARGKPFTIGVVGTGKMLIQLERNAAGMRVRNLPVVIKRVATQADAAGCQVVYFENDTSFLPELRNGAILTIGEAASFCSSGGMIGFKQVGTKLRFAINKTAASKSRVELSAQLLRLAIPE